MAITIFLFQKENLHHFFSPRVAWSWKPLPVTEAAFVSPLRTKVKSSQSQDNPSVIRFNAGR